MRAGYRIYPFRINELKLWRLYIRAQIRVVSQRREL
jgi:hypothetical protein